MLRWKADLASAVSSRRPRAGGKAICDFPSAMARTGDRAGLDLSHVAVVCVWYGKVAVALRPEPTAEQAKCLTVPVWKSSVLGMAN